jgi:hypothetical protein
LLIPWDQLRAVEGRRLEKPLGVFRRIASRQKVLFCLDQAYAEQIRRNLTYAFKVVKPRKKDAHYDHARISLSCSNLALDPVILVTMVRFYQQVPAARSELASVHALDRFRGTRGV